MPRSLSLLIAAALLACTPTPPPPPGPPGPHGPPPPPPPGSAAPEALVMRAYDVPAVYAPEVAGVVNRMLWRGQNLPREGNAETGMGGLLIVTAPAGIHPGVEQLVTRLKEKAPAPPATVEITYWALTGVPAEAPSVPAALEEVKPALEAVLKNEGPRVFNLLEKQRIRSMAGYEAEVLGRHFEIGQNASAREGRVSAQLRIRSHKTKASLQTFVQLPADELLVLGQAAIEVPDTLQDQPRASVYYIVRAHIVD